MFTRKSNLFFLIIFITLINPDYLLNSMKTTNYNIESYTKTKWGSDYTVDVRLRTIDVTVLDKYGKHLLGLKPEDFKIYEDGVEQKISSFDFVNHLKHLEIKNTNISSTGNIQVSQTDIQDKTPEPRYFALAVLDMTMYPKRNMQVIDALEEFVTTKISPGDHVAVYQVSRSFVKCLMPFTRSHDLVLEKLKNGKDGLLLSGNNLSLNSSQFAATMQTINSYADMKIVKENVPGFLEDVLKRERNWVFNCVINNIRILGNSIKDYYGKKNLILFSTGLPYYTFDEEIKPFSTGIKNSIENLSNDFNANNLSIFVMDLGKWEVQEPASIMSLNDELTDYSDNEAARVAGFRTVSDMTGGEFYYHTLTTPEKIERSLDDINYKTGMYYTIGYYPVKDPLPGKSVDIKIKTNRDDLSISYRRTLYTPKMYNQLDNREKEQYFTDAIFSPLTHSQLFLTTDLRLFPTAGGKFIAQYSFQMDKKEIIHKDSGNPVSKLDLVCLLYTENRDLVKNVHKELYVDFYDRYENKNIDKVRFYDYMVLPSGKYILRYLIRDQFSGYIASDELKIEVPNKSKEDMALSSLMVIGENKTLMVLSEYIPLPGREEIEIDQGNPQYYKGNILSQTISEPIRNYEDCSLFFTVSSELKRDDLQKLFHFSLIGLSKSIAINTEPKLIDIVKHSDGTTGFLYKLNTADLKPDDYIIELSLTDNRGKKYMSRSFFKVI